MELVILGIIIGAVGHWAYNKYLSGTTHTLDEALVKVEQEVVKVEEKIKEEVVKVEEKVKRPRRKAGTTAV
jgi:hypothetical protein